jgi:hypothetical protein
LMTGAAAMVAAVFRRDALAWIAATTIVVVMIRLRLFGHYELGLLRGAIKLRISRLLPSRFFRHNRLEPNSQSDTLPAEAAMDENILATEHSGQAAPVFALRETRRKAA